MTSEIKKQSENPLLNRVSLKEGISCRNRIALAAMTHFSSPKDGSISEAELDYIERRSAGPGLVFTACVAVSPSGKAYEGEPAAHNDSFISGLAIWAKRIQSVGAKAVLQLHHGGGVCPPSLVPNGDVISPSGIATPDRSLVVPRTMSETEIEQVVESFQSATDRAFKAGFDGVEIHGGFGYLPQQFLSPYTNRRSDLWGGSREKRHAFPLALVSAAQKVVRKNTDARPFAIGYRFTPEEELEPGLTMDDAMAFVDALIGQKVDFIDVLVNDYRNPPRRGAMAKDRSRLCFLAEAVAGRVPLLAGGEIHTEDDALAALNTGIDFITLGRALIIDPEWVQKVATGVPGTIRTKLEAGQREALTIPEPFWKTIWSAPGWFPGVS